MIGSYFKNFLILIVKIVNSFYAVFNCLIIFLRLLGSGRPIFVNVEGGFGHSLAAPTCLKSLCTTDFYLVFFYTKERHNFLTRDAFGDNFIWCRVTIPGLPYFSLRVHQILGLALVKVLAPVTAGAYDLRQFFDKSTYNPWMAQSEFYPEYYSNPYRRTYMFRLAQSVGEISDNGISDYYIKKLNINPLGLLINTKRRICAIAHRDFRPSNDFSKDIRNSRSISDLKSIVSYLTNDANYHVVLCGNVHGKSFELFASNPNVTFPAKVGFDRNEYDFYAGMLFDVFIGPMSGSIDYARCRNVPNLILDSFPYGWATPRATLAFRDKKFYGSDDLKNFLLKSYQDYSVREVGFVPQGVAFDIVKDFIENVDNPGYGIDPLDIGITVGPLVDGRCKISPAWYRYCVQIN